MSISSKLLQVNQTKQNIKKAIEDKGVNLTATEFSNYNNKITELEKKININDEILGGVFNYTKVEQINSTLKIEGIAPLVQKENNLYFYLKLISENEQNAKEEETKTISNADFSGGNLVVEPTTNKVMTKVTVNKDTNLTTENIKDGVTIFGVEGNYSGGIEPFNFMFIIQSLWDRGMGVSFDYALWQADDNTGTNATKIFEKNHSDPDKVEVSFLMLDKTKWYKLIGTHGSVYGSGYVNFTFGENGSFSSNYNFYPNGYIKLFNNGSDFSFIAITLQQDD